MAIRPFRGTFPNIAASAFIELSAQVVGDVTLGEESSVWFNCVLRGDVHHIRIGARTNIQDLSLIHVSRDLYPTVVGDDVTVGHHVVLHGCRVGSRVLVGMGAVLLDGVEVEDDCIVGAGTLLTPGTRVPAGSMVLGSPGRVKRLLTDEERAFLQTSAANYVSLARTYQER